MSENKGLFMKYFILKPSGTDQYALASRKAMLEYAKVIEVENPVLAKEMQYWVSVETVKASGPSGPRSSERINHD